MRLLGLSVSSSTFLLCVVALFCDRKVALAEMQHHQEAGSTYDAQEGLMKLDVVVTDKLGTPVSGLARGDFKLLDNGLLNKILTFHPYDGSFNRPEPPAKIILLVDTLNVPERLASYERREVERFLQQNGGHLDHPVSLVELSNTGLLTVGQPSAEGNALAAEFAHNKNLEWIRRKPGGMRGESLDSLYTEPAPLSALKALGDIAAMERQRPGRKLLIWVGPGWGLGSGAYVDSMGPKQDTFDTIEWFSTLLREARIALYNFSVDETNADGRALSYLSLLGGVKAAQQATFMHLNRKVLAVQSGGRVLQPTADLIGGPVPALTDFKPNADLVLQIDSCVREADVFYTVSFDPSHADRPDEYHDLKVQVGAPDLIVRTTTGYYDQPYYADQANSAVRPVTVEQLEQMLSTAHVKPDAEMARQLSELTLSERLSSPKLSAWIAGLRGGKSREALVALADASAFLDPPGGEIPAAAAPDRNAQQHTTSLALEYLDKALPNFPNFYATRTTTHYQETPPFEKGDARITYQPLHIADTVKDTVLYRNGFEIGESDSGKNKKRKVDEPYLMTYGTFGPLLRGVLDAIVLTPGGLTWRRWEQGGGKLLAVFDYAIPVEKSSYDTGGCCLPDGDGISAFQTRTGYHGEIVIDPASGALLRLEVIFDLQSTTPLIQSEVMIEYGPVEIGGKSYTCPLRTVSISRGRSVAVLSDTLKDREKIEWRESFRTYGPYATMLDDIAFDAFHMFRADSQMLTGFKPAPEGKPLDTVPAQTPAATPTQR